MKYEPSRLEILLTKIAFLFYGKSVYRAFANSLPLKGNDRVLDFGAAYQPFFARRLTLFVLIFLLARLIYPYFPPV
jgi:hypothetical protein